MPPGTVPSWQSPQRLLTIAALVALFCWATVSLTRGSGPISAISLGNGLVLGLLLSRHTRDWPALLAASYVGNLAAHIFDSRVAHHGVLLSAFGTLEIFAAAWPLRRRFGLDFDFTSTAALLYFTAFCLLLAPAISGLMASWLLARAEGATVSEVFGLWYPADALGILIITPLVLALRAQSDLRFTRLRWRRAILPWLLVAGTTLLVFSQQRHPLLFLVLPPLLLLTYLQGLAGSILGVVTITVIAVAATDLGHGPIMLIDAASERTRILMLQLFVLIAASKGLVVGMLLAQRERLTMALSRSEQKLRTVTDNLPAVIAHVDAQERYRFVNTQAGKVLRCDPETMVGRTLREVRGEAAYARVAPHVQRALTGEATRFESQATLSGQALHYQSNFIPDIAPDGSVQGFFAMSFDITDRKSAELRQAASEERLRTITDNLPVLIAYLDAEGRYGFCNFTHEQWFDKPVGEWLGRSYREVLDDDFATAQAAHVDDALRGKRVDAELSLSNGDSRRIVRASYLPHRDPNGTVVGIYVLMNDITSLKTVQTQLSQLARYDTLTGLANRREFQDRLEMMLARNHRTGASHALLFIDIDHFKRINDGRGHAAGDAVLAELAMRLQASVRATDTVARFAGDEFVVILDGLGNAEESQFIARKIIAAMEQPVLFHNEPIAVTVSIGIGFDALCRLGPDELLSLADGALYEAKLAGRNTQRLRDSRAPNPPRSAAAAR